MAKVGILLLKSRDSRAIFLRFYYQQIRLKTLSGGGGGDKNGNFNTIYRGIGIFKRKFKMY